MTSLAVFAALALAAPAKADTVMEMGDAGALPGMAQLIPAGITVDFITGSLAMPNDADAYRIFITDPAGFSATTVGQPGTLLDTQLFLFTSAGFGVEANDDAAVGVRRSTLPAGNPFSPTAPGEYILVITAFDNDPLSPGGARIFPEIPIGMVVGPTGPGGAFPLAGYTGGGTGAGTYQIALTGVGTGPPVGVIPEPGSIVLLGVSLVALAGYGRRRWRKAV